jgi:hypothetical protein
MKVDFAFICDYAEARDKINALGIGFERIFAQRVPAKHPHFSVVVQIKFTRTEAGTKDVQVHLTDADGTDIIPAINGKLVVNTPPSGILESATRLVMEFANVEFKAYGNYAIRVDIATQEVVSIPLSVVQPPQNPGLPQNN